MKWNSLYPSDEDTGSLEDAIKEAEWEDDLRQAEQKWREENEE